MKTDRAFAFIALLALLSFFSVVIAFVPHVDLVIAIGIGLALACYDIWDQLWRRKPR